MYESRGARLHERLNTIIKEARLRGYFPFDELIQMMAIAGGAAARVMQLTEAGKHVLQALDQKSSAIGLDANFQERLFFLKFERQARGHLKRKRPGRVDARSRPQLAVNKLVALLKKAKERAFLLLTGKIALGCRRVCQKFHQRFVVILFMQQIQRAKHGAALRENVDAAVFVIFQFLRDGGGAADGGDAFFAGEDYAEFAIVRDAVLDHQLVARLENVQRKRRARVKDDVKREQRYARVGHDLVVRVRASARLTQQRQRGLHFVARVHVAGILRDENSVG
jgi:hypothetical protein